MRGPRKVRVFKDPKKSPNWYVEWRDETGRRHCESCGPDEADARQRARQVREELDRKRSGSASQQDSGGNGSADSQEPSGPVVQLRAILRGGPVEIPLDLSIEFGPEALRAISRMLAEHNRG